MTFRSMIFRPMTLRTSASLLGKVTGVVAGAALALLSVGVSIGRAEAVNVHAMLKADLETPPNASKGTGTLVGTYDPATKTLVYDVMYADLTGPATAAHFHAPATVGKSAAVEIPITGPLTSPIKGKVTLTDAQVANLTDGMTYFNIHTAANKGGEIRGQVDVMK